MAKLKNEEGEGKLNKKYAIVSIVLIALMSLSLVPMGAFAHHTPSSTDDNKTDFFGPKPAQYLVSIYTDYAAELAAFKNKEFDIWDWGLDPVDYQWFEANDPNHAQYSTAFYAEFGLFQYDVNNVVAPTNIIAFRQALSHLVDKDYFIGVNLPNAAVKADSPLASITGWYGPPQLTDLYNLQPRTTMTPLPDDPADWEAAYQLFVQALGAPIVDPEDPAYYTWHWDSPFNYIDPSGNYGPIADNHLLVWARSDSNPARAAQGQFIKDCLETALPDMAVSLGHPRVHIHVDLYLVGRGITYPEVMIYGYFHLYTGGWSLNRDPDFLQYYTIDQQIPYPPGDGNNYIFYTNPNFDTEVYAMLNSPYIGVPSNPCDGVYHAFQAQQIMMGDAGLIPVWAYAGYKAYLANWRGVVNQIGYGTNTWWTFLNAHKVGSQSSDVIRYGWQGDVLKPNPMSYKWLWESFILGEVYDSLIAVDPYNMAHDMSYLTNGWETNTWVKPDLTTATKITFHLRDDVFWQDIPFLDRTAISWDNGAEINGPFVNYQLNPIDVAFSFIYTKNNPLAVTFATSVENFDHAEMNMNIWGDLWQSVARGDYNANTPEFWNSPDPWPLNYLVNNPTYGQDDITIYLDSFMPWIGLHKIGGVAILPYHLWRWIPMSSKWDAVRGSDILNPLPDASGYDLLYGTGPYVYLTRTPGVSLTMIPYRKGNAYRGITLDNSYFYQAVRPTEEVGNIDEDWSGLNGQSIYFGENLTNYDSAATYVIDYYFDYTIAVNGVTVADSVTATKQATLLPGQNLYIEQEVYTLSGTTVHWGDRVSWRESFHWIYVSGDPDLVGSGGYATDRPGFWSDDESFVHVHFPDISGAAAPANGIWPEVYVAADGVVNIRDASLIGANWQKTVPAGAKVAINNAAGATARADITNDGTVNIRDASLVGANWQRTWTP